LREAGVVALEEAGQEAIRRPQIRDAGKGELDYEAVLESSPQALYAAFGLGRMRRDR
jgi:hypothetical protein